MNNKDHLVGQLTRCTFDMPSKSSGVHQVPVCTSGYQCTRCTKKTKTKSAVLPTSLMSFFGSIFIQRIDVISTKLCRCYKSQIKWIGGGFIGHFNRRIGFALLKAV